MAVIESTARITRNVLRIFIYLQAEIVSEGEGYIIVAVFCAIGSIEHIAHTDCTAELDYEAVECRSDTYFPPDIHAVEYTVATIYILTFSFLYALIFGRGVSTANDAGGEYRTGECGERELAEVNVIAYLERNAEAEAAYGSRQLRAVGDSALGVGIGYVYTHSVVVKAETGLEIQVFPQWDIVDGTDVESCAIVEYRSGDVSASEVDMHVGGARYVKAKSHAEVGCVVVGVERDILSFCRKYSCKE